MTRREPSRRNETEMGGLKASANDGGSPWMLFAHSWKPLTLWLQL